MTPKQVHPVNATHQEQHEWIMSIVIVVVCRLFVRLYVQPVVGIA